MHNSNTKPEIECLHVTCGSLGAICVQNYEFAMFKTVCMIRFLERLRLLATPSATVLAPHTLVCATPRRAFAVRGLDITQRIANAHAKTNAPS